MKTLQRCAFACILLFPPFLTAQTVHPGDVQGTERPSDRIENLRKVRLVEVLELKEDQSVRFLARMNEHDNARRALMKERGEALDRLERLVRNKADDGKSKKGLRTSPRSTQISSSRSGGVLCRAHRHPFPHPAGEDAHIRTAV